MENRELPLVSAVITSCGREKGIVRRALDSVLSQTYPNMEILLIDDNVPKDNPNSRDLLELSKEAGQRVKYFRNSGVHGAQGARNEGIRKSRGEFIAFLDDDDEWLPEKTAKQVRLLMKHPEVGLCYTDGEIFDETKDPPIIRPIRQKAIDIKGTYRKLLKEDFIGSTSQAMVRREVFFKVGGFDRSLPARQDYEMWIRISRSYKIMGISEGLYRYHIVKGTGQISNKWKNCAEGHIRVYQKYKKDIDKDKDAGFYVAFRLAHYYGIGGKSEKNPEYILKALGYYIIALFISPMNFMNQGKYRIIRELEKKGFCNKK